ncbi:MAG: sigma-E factor regulatory protein RseB domain-containing protein [Gammaproteobacteria bacterium]
MRIAAYLLVALLAAPLAARAADDSSAQARQWLKKMEHAVKTMNYEGSFVYIHGDHLEAMRIVHVADKTGEHERLLSLTGAAREILRDNDMLTCILPDTRSVVVEKSRPRKYIPAGLLTLDKKLFRYYEFKMLGQDRMTGRAAQVIEVKARDQYRYGYRLWLERPVPLRLPAVAGPRDRNVAEVRSGGRTGHAGGADDVHQHSDGQGDPAVGVEAGHQRQGLQVVPAGEAALGAQSGGTRVESHPPAAGLCHEHARGP